MKQLAYFFILFPFLSTGQNVAFKDGVLENGLIYPVVSYPDDAAVEASINAIIGEKIAVLKTNEYCIGQYGYVQRAGFIQIHIYANCMEMVSSENYYYLFDLETGKEAFVSQMINPESQSEFAAYLSQKIEGHLTSKGVTISDEKRAEIQLLTLDDLQSKLDKGGIFLYNEHLPEWGKEGLLLPWGELQSYFKLRIL